MNGNNGDVLDQCEVDELMAKVYTALSVKPKQVQILSGSNKGDGYMSFLTRVDVTTEEGELVQVVMKSAPRIAELRKVAPVRNAFLREIFFYETIIPEFHKFQTIKYSVHAPFNSTPKYYHSCKTDGNEVLIMENIKMKGFQLWDRMKLMDHQHIELVFKTYGKFHAVSYAMQQKDPECYESMASQLPDVFTVDNVDPSMFQIFQGSAAKLAALFKDENREIYDKLGAFGDGMQDYWRFIEQNPGDYPVICHGDCWVNNMMFQYKDLDNPEKPTDIRLLDFQIAKVGSPVLDLSYFFYVSAPKEILNQLDKYLHIYYDSLCESLKEMDCDSTVLPFDGLKREWKTYSKFGLTMSLAVSKIMMSEADEVIDFSCNIEAVGEAFNKEFKHDDFVNNKLKLLAHHMFDNDFL